ncbi:NUDIX hydrolase [Myroides injenensis]|uniref:NUDIX hydrolase n=1 Tax=Myroides injenensis TaxID=1183151 RepID=UPI000289B4DD|nr:NUDIX domain-containing protein [Myroides injenensis]
MSNNKIYLASAIITNQNSELLTVRKKGSKYYMMPGGKIEVNENSFQALKRELLEELNFQISAKDVSFIGSHSTEAINESNTTVTADIFHIQIDYLDFKPNAEIEEVLWLNKLNYNNYPLAHLIKEFSIPKWLKDQL